MNQFRIGLCQGIEAWVLVCVTVATGCNLRQPALPKGDPFAERQQAATKLLEAGNLDGAITEFTHAIALYSQSEKAFLGRGIAYLKKGFPDTALEDLNQAVRLAPGNADAYLHRARANLALNNLMRAVSDCTRAIRLHPAQAEIYQQRGLTYLKWPNYAGAIADLQEAIRLDPALAPSLGPVLAETRQLAAKADAARSSTVASAEPPLDAASQPPALASAPHTVRKPVSNSDHQQADQVFEQGASLLTQGRYDEAITKLSEAIAMDSRFGSAYVERAKAHLMRGFPDTAIADLNDALSCDPMDEEAYCLRSRARLSRGDYVLAAADATEALRQNAGLVVGYELRLRAYLGQSDCDRAIGDYEELLRQAPARAQKFKTSLADAYYQRLRLRIKSPHPESILSDWQSLQRLDATLAGDLQEELAEVLLRQGREQAERGFEREALAFLATLKGMGVRQSRELDAYLQRLARGDSSDGPGPGRIARTR